MVEMTMLNVDMVEMDMVDMDMSDMVEIDIVDMDIVDRDKQGLRTRGSSVDSILSFFNFFISRMPGLKEHWVEFTQETSLNGWYFLGIS